jgi:hypothetical protein
MAYTVEEFQDLIRLLQDKRGPSGGLICGASC